MHDTKIGIILRDDLLVWQRLNITAFLASGIARTYPESVGEDYADASGRQYLPLFVQPVMVYCATAEQLQRARARAVEREVPIAIYTEEIFNTFNDQDNRAAVAVVATEDLQLVGLALRAEKKIFDKIIKGLKLHA